MGFGRIIVAGLVGGTVMFAWGAFSHMVTPIGEMGISELPSEEAIVPTIAEHVAEPGFYFFPGYGSATQTPEADERWKAKVKAGPNGILIVKPGPGPDQVMPPGQLVREWASGTLAALIVALVLSWLPCTRLGKAAVACGIGIAGWLSIDVSYWNWYHFPGALTLGGLLDQGIGWLLTGLAMAPIVGGGRARGTDHEKQPAGLPG